MTIKTDYAAPSAEALERTVTEPLERGLGKLIDVAQVRSQTTRDQSVITVTFKAAGAPSCEAFRDVSRVVLEAQRSFPAAVPTPQVSFGDGKCRQDVQQEQK